jgi:hypothetical protein
VRETRFSALNRVYQAMATLIDVNSCDVITLDGRLDHELLHKAMIRALRKHPPMQAHFVHGWPGDRWRVPDEELPLDLHVHQLPVDDWEVVEPHLMSHIWEPPLPLYEGRPVRMHLTETPGRSYLQIIHTHIYADAKSCYRVVGDLAGSYNAYAEDKPWDDSPLDLPDRSIQGLLGLPFKERLRYLMEAGKMNMRDFSTPEMGLALPDVPVGPRAIKPVHFSRELTERIEECGRKRGSSGHGLLRLAFLRTATEFNRERGVDRPELRLWDLFSLRRLIGPESEEVYDSLVIPFPMDLDNRWSDAEVLANATAQVRALRDGMAYAHVYRLHILFNYFDAVLPTVWLEKGRRSLTRSNVFFTNPGPYPYPLESFGSVPVVDYYTFPQLFPPGRVIFIITGLRGRLRIHALHDTNSFPEGLEPLLDPFLARIEQLCDET